ncbi:hypothetical protein D7D52_10025 [Nocardia yunnanensis]|uniref:Acyl-ACP desaturase n=1 Tax=Nocardia yunnanensis TaxID=2382165 RepID=A0A386ZAK9_9NOCA|nr:hypothetical protein D7D52_10025 [Nocardia yunnanensis]
MCRGTVSWTAKDWNPHDYVPWDEGRNFAAMGGIDWDPEQSRLSEVAKVAMITNLLTEDNLPSYHRTIAENFSMDGAWGTWVGRWTAEENRHAIAMRDYLVVTRSVDPVALDSDRMVHMTKGVHMPVGYGGVLDQVVYVTFQELATRISHRTTGKVCDDPIADRLLARIAADENLHMIFYRNITAAAFDLAPDQVIDLHTGHSTRWSGSLDARRQLPRAPAGRGRAARAPEPPSDPPADTRPGAGR